MIVDEDASDCSSLSSAEEDLPPSAAASDGAQQRERTDSTAARSRARSDEPLGSRRYSDWKR
jgi:hypothetical protein